MSKNASLLDIFVSEREVLYASYNEQQNLEGHRSLNVRWLLVFLHCCAVKANSFCCLFQLIFLVEIVG